MINGCVQKALAILVLSGMVGCATGPFHRKSTPAPAPPPPPPELSQTPLYSPEMSENNPRVPSLPAENAKVVAKAPEPAPVKPKKTRKAKPAPASTAKGAAGDTEHAAVGGQGAAGSAGTQTLPAGAAGTPIAAVDKRADTNQTKSGQPAGSLTVSSPIGELTAGDSEATAQTSRQTADLIKSTRDGVDAIKRVLSSDEKKTVAEIATFLARAEQALKNGDVDGAAGLATKAKLLLDELTEN